MQIKLKTLVDALDKFKPVVSKRPTLPVLGGLHLTSSDGQLTLAGTDLEQSLTVELPLTSSGFQLGVVVPFVIFHEAVKALAKRKGNADQELSLELVDGRLAFWLNNRRHELDLLDLDDYPALPNPPVASNFTIAGKLLASAAAQVLVAAGTDQTRPVLTGVLVEGNPGEVRLVATDSYRLTFRELQVTWTQEPTQALVPAAVLAHASKIFAGVDQVTVWVGATFVTFTGGGMQLVVKAIEGEFPKYRLLVPDSMENTATFAKADLVDALVDLHPYCSHNNPVRVHMNGGLELTAQLQDRGRGSANVDADRAGSDVQTAFNPQYLADGVKAVAGERVTLEARDGLKPALIHNADPDGFTYLLMPIRLPS